MHKRVVLSYLGLMLVFGLLIANIGIIGLNIGSTATSESTSNKTITLGTSRGMIYDSEMRRLVNSESQNFIVCLPTTNAFNTISNYFKLFPAFLKKLQIF